MRKLWLVARKELRMTATKTYFIATVVGPVVIVALMVLPSLLARSQVESSLAGRTLAIVADEWLLPAVRAELTQLGVTLEEAAAESGLADRVRAGDLDGYVVFPSDVLGAEAPRYVTDLVLDSRQGQLSDAIGRALVRLRLERSGLDAERITGLARIPEIQMLVLGKQGEVQQDAWASFLIVVGVIGVLIVMLEVYGQGLGRAVLTEKSDKTAEIMLSSLKPFELLAGKMLGKAPAGLLQYLAWVLVAVAVIEVIRPHLDAPMPPFVQAGNLLAVLGFFAIGFLLYSSVYAVAGAIAADADNYAQLIWPVSAMQMATLALTVAVQVRPDGPLAVALSLLPLTAHVVMFMRIFIGDPGGLQIAVAVAGAALLTVAAVWAAGKAFRLGILFTGTRATLREVVRLLRA